MNTKTPIASATISFAALPALNAELEGGIFAGVITRKDGVHCAVILLSGKETGLTWRKAMNWAKKQDGELPSRPVAALLYANVKDKLDPRWHWTSEEYDFTYAWYCHFGYGYYDYYSSKSAEGAAVAVRMIPIIA